MKILLVGGGGREHALAWRLALSDDCKELYCAPGNAGIEECSECVDIAADDVEALVSFAKDKAIDFVVIGPEAPLVLGLADRLQKENILSFGPTAAAAQLEGSKKFMKDLCVKYGVKTAAYGSFTDIDEAKKFIEKNGAPIVVKADGLAAGKGVIIAETAEEAVEAAENMLSGNAFGDAGASIIIEEFLDGPEISYFALADGKSFIPFSSAQDHKRVGDNDTGPNTGGMGTCSPAPLMTPELEEKIGREIIQPVIDGMAAEGCAFTGVLFAGLIMVDGEPVLLEFNTRFGDPECQTLMVRLDFDLLAILRASAEGNLDDVADDIMWLDDAAVCVVVANDGYPGSYNNGAVIKNIAKANLIPATKIFHAGTARDDQGNFVSQGGRVLGVTSYGEGLMEARVRAYESVNQIDWPEGFCRSDIGARAKSNDK